MSECYYSITVLKGTQLIFESNGFGDNAIHAFEKAAAQGGVFLPTQEPVKVVMVNQESGVSISFEANKLC